MYWSDGYDTDDTDELIRSKTAPNTAPRILYSSGTTAVCPDVKSVPVSSSIILQNDWALSIRRDSAPRIPSAADLPVGHSNFEYLAALEMGRVPDGLLNAARTQSANGTLCHNDNPQPPTAAVAPAPVPAPFRIRNSFDFEAVNKRPRFHVSPPATTVPNMACSAVADLDAQLDQVLSEFQSASRRQHKFSAQNQMAGAGTNEARLSHMAQDAADGRTPWDAFFRNRLPPVSDPEPMEYMDTGLQASRARLSSNFQCANELRAYCGEDDLEAVKW